MPVHLDTIWVLFEVKVTVHNHMQEEDVAKMVVGLTSSEGLLVSVYGFPTVCQPDARRQYCFC